jgi:hypothetical protein
VAKPHMLLFPFALFLNGLNKKYSEGFQKDIREYTDFWGGKLMISCQTLYLSPRQKKLQV